jgi:hypothetical protein
VKIPDTGSLRGDLLAIARGSAATASSPQGQAVVERAIERGEHPDPAFVERLVSLIAR